MSLIILILVTASSVSAGNDEKSSNLMDSLQKIRDAVLSQVHRKSKDTAALENGRKAKSYGYYPYFNTLNYPYPHDMGYYMPQGKTPVPQEWRTEPFKRKNSQQLLDSPIYYVRLPPSPYVFVPGMGFVSRPPSLNEPEVMNAITDAKPEHSNQGDIQPENFLHVPIDFVSNGKPTGVYQLPNDPPKPKPGSGYYNLEKGPYLFNGKPIELYVLRNSYNHMYADALTNFYP